MRAAYEVGSPEIRFWSKVIKTNNCWLWTAALRGGYGIFRDEGRNHNAHRWLWQKIYGAVPAGKELDHLCNTKNCVNPEHIKAVAHQENVSRAPAGGRTWRSQITHCPHGHAYTPDNTYVHRGKRNCRSCRSLTNMSRKAKKCV